MDQRRFVEACEAGFQPIRSAATAAADTFAAFERARRERRPIVLDAPKDVQLETYPWDWSYTPSIDFAPRPQRVSPGRETIEEAANIIAACHRPVIIAGQGAIRSDARDSIMALARQSGALVATTLLAKGWLDEDPFCVGISGAFSSAVAEELFTEADLVIAVGASLNYFTTEGGLLYPGARYLWINLEASPRQGARSDDFFVQGDADTVVRSLLEILSARGHSIDGFRTDEVMNRFLPWSGTSNVSGDGVEPREAVRIIDKFVSEDDLVVLGIGHYWSFPIQYMHGPQGGGFIFTHQFGAIGQCLSSAIGVAVGRPDKRVIAFEGDGSLMMHLQELETAARSGIPLVVVVLNDQALGSELHHLEAEGIASTIGSVLPTPQLAEVATALGCNGATANSLDELEAAWHAYADALDRPFLLDIRVSRSVSDPYQKLTLGIANRAPHQGKSVLAVSALPGKTLAT